MTLATELTAVTVTLDLAKANLNALSSTVNSEIAARDATIAALQAQIAAGTPVPVVPTLTLSSSLATISGTIYTRITCSWNVPATNIARNGNDAFNSGAYTTPIASTDRSFTFDYCLSNSTYIITLTLPSPAAPITNSTTTPTIVVGGGGGTPAAGAHLLGVYMGNSPGDTSYFGGLVNHTVKVLNAYCDIQYGLPTMFGAGGVTAWLQQDSSRRLVLGCNALTDDPGNFESGVVTTRMQQLATAIVAQGIASQVIIRFCYEMNGDWMPWGRQYAGNNDGTRYKAMWRRCFAAVNAIHAFEWDWCPIFWDTGDQWNDGIMNSDWFYPGDDVLTWVGSDNYDVYASGSEAQRWLTVRARMQNQVTFAARHGKVPVQDEWACWNAAVKQGGGDNPTYIANHLQFQKDNGYGWGLYFNSTAGEVNMVLTDAPNALNAFRAHAWT